jgi:riboflavin kinase/FMN adenylyltransferase
MAETLRPAPDDESWLPPDCTGTVATVGTFDGVHRGHHEVLARLAARAHALGLRSLLVTFEPHPLEVVNSEVAPHLLTPGREKLAALAESGVDYVAVVPFTRTLASYEAAQFVDLVLRDRLRMRELFIGYDHGFGRGRSGDAQMLRKLGAQRGFTVEVVEPVSVTDGRAVSSTAIRRAVAGGDLDRAALGLGRPYGVTGPVVQGERRGRLLGYPTLNVALPSPRKLLPPEGVYAVRVHTRTGTYAGMCNLGPRPTFGDTARSLEAHLFDAEGDWYGQTVGVDFVARLRDTRRFDGVEELAAQLGRDAQHARRALQRAR